jgi:hypothetical protein
VAAGLQLLLPVSLPAMARAWPEPELLQAPLEQAESPQKKF